MPLIRRLAPVVVLAWTYLITFARAARLPNDYAEAHWLLDYRFGPMKRGLVGSLVSLGLEPFGQPATPTIIAVVAIVLSALAAAASLGIVVRMCRLHDGNVGPLALGLVFASSPFVVMSAHLIGYLDAILHIATAAAILAVLRGRLLVAAILSVLAVLVHESYLLVGLPLVVVAVVMSAVPAGDRRTRWAPVMLVAGAPLAAFLAMVALQSAFTDPMVLRAQLQAHLTAAGFVESQSRTVAEWHTTGFLQHLRAEHGYLADRLLNGTVLTALAPSLLAMLVILHSMFRSSLCRGDAVLLVLAVAAPLLLHVVAWDTVRISIETIAGALLAAWIVTETRPARPPSVVAVGLAMVAIVANALVRIPLMDGEAVRRFSPAVLLPALLLLLLAWTWRDRRRDDGARSGGIS